MTAPNDPFLPLLSPYLDGELPAAETSRLETHLPACAACREELSRLRGLSAALRALPERALPAGFRERLQRRRTEAEGSGNWLRPLPALSYAAAAVFVGLSARTWLSERRPAPAVSPMLHAAEPLPAPAAPAAAAVAAAAAPLPRDARAPGEPVEPAARAADEGAQAASSTNMTNEQLHAELEREKARMGIRRIAPPRRFPMGELAGLGAAVSAPEPVAIGGSVARLPPGPVIGPPGVIVHGESQRAALWSARRLRTAAPKVDWSRQELVVVCSEGPGFGLTIAAVQTFPDRVVVQYREPDVPEDAARDAAAACRSRVLPKSPLPVIFQKLP